MVTGRLKNIIEGFEEYEVSETGNVYNLRTCIPEFNHIETLSKRIDRAGYYTVRLYSGKPVTKYLHRLIAEAFIPNPENKKYINHKDGNKLNNKVNNLEWTTHKENVNHAYQNGLIKQKTKPVIDTRSGMVFKSLKEAAKHLGLNYSTLKNYLNGNRPNPTCLEYGA